MSKAYSDCPEWMRITDTPITTAADLAQPWTEEDQRELFQLRTIGLPWNEIGKVMERPPGKCKAMYESMGG